MIVSRLFGGTGNQLFQYAAGRALADRLGTELALDRRYVTRPGAARGDCFVHFARARLAEPPRLPPAKMDGMLRYARWRLFGRCPRFHRERGPGFDPGFFDLPDDTYLHGYWQSWRYFGPDPARLRAELTMTTPLDAANAAMAARIAAAPVAVSVHVRRGDYVGDGAYAACHPAYYRAAVAHIAGRVGQPLTCFVFSNDPAWARANLSLGGETVIVDLNDEAAGHFDLHLQSLCDHHIIANSTFSWWGAWLNPRPGRIVVAPRAWFGPGRPDNPDLCPPDWLRL
ncbi:MAG: alpha-1,2-fucosyltransferase [Roseovarius sp.]